MTDQDQQAALCEWAGWTRRTITHEAIGGTKTYWCDPDRNRENDSEEGPSIESLDWMHELEGKLSEEQRTAYHFNLVSVCDDGVSHWPTWYATAAQRREALLRTIGKWKD